jgi:hypothetical protein
MTWFFLKFVVFFAFLCNCAFAQATAVKCWIKEVTFDQGQIEVVFDPAVQLSFEGSAKMASTVAKIEQFTKFILTKGTSLKVKELGSGLNRCELEPVLGLEFQGISSKVWLQSSSSITPIFFGTVIKASPK